MAIARPDQDLQTLRPAPSQPQPWKRQRIPSP